MNYKTKELGILLEEVPETYYWIGFLLADGTFYEKTRAIGLCLSDKDKEHLINFIKYIKSDCVITTRKNNFNSYDGEFSKLHQIWVSYKNIVTDIINKFGICPKKTYNPPNLPLIADDDLFISMFIGFIDGDGSISYVNNKYTEIRIKIHKSWDLLLQSFVCRLYAMVDLTYPKGRYVLKKYYVSSIGNSKVIKLLKNKAIELNLPILQRKWEKIDLNFVSSKEIASNKKFDILNNLQQGKTRREIANIVNLDYSSVCKIIKNINKLK